MNSDESTLFVAQSSGSSSYQVYCPNKVSAKLTASACSTTGTFMLGRQISATKKYLGIRVVFEASLFEQVTLERSYGVRLEPKAPSPMGNSEEPQFYFHHNAFTKVLFFGLTYSITIFKDVVQLSFVMS
jgi:hypothetical protein